METVGRNERSSAGRTGAPPRRVFGVIAGALLVAVFLNAPELETEAKAKPYGRDRDIWVNVWKPFATVSRTLQLDEPRKRFDNAIGRGNQGQVFELPPIVDEIPEPPAQALRTPTKEDPLRIWVGGDSMSKVLGEALLRQAGESGFFDAEQDSQLSSGLVRPDFFDWPGKFADLARDDDANEVFVLVFGANDNQGIKTPEGDIFQPEGKDLEGWEREYRRRVAGTMDVLKAEGRLVIWIGQPNMRDEDTAEAMARMSKIYREEAEKRPWVRFFDLWPLFVDGGGKYDPYIKDDDGELKLMRHPDGVHLVREGGEKAARHILDLVKAEAQLEDEAPVQPAAAIDPSITSR